MTILSREALNRGKDARGHTGRPFVARLTSYDADFFLLFNLRDKKRRHTEVNISDSDNNASERFNALSSFPLA